MLKIGQSAAKFELMNWNNLRKDIPSIGKLGPLSESDKNRIDKNVILMNDCLIWTGTKHDNKKGHQHGCFWYNKKYVQVHRLIYHNFIDNVPEYKIGKDNLQVNHKCDTDGKCVNPTHLYLGTPKQNTQDCIKNGNKYKTKSGEDNHNAVLKDEIVEIIKKLKNSGLSQKEIAEKYGVNQSQISRWWNNKTRTKDV